MHKLHAIRTQLKDSKVVALVGVAKSGTTSLADFMSQQGIAQFGRKENHLFNSFGMRSKVVPFASSYIRMKQNAIIGKMGYILESTPLSVYPEAAARMSIALPQAKVLFVVRDPAERALSHFRMLKQRCQGLKKINKQNPTHLQCEQYTDNFEKFVLFEMKWMRKANCTGGTSRTLEECMQCVYHCRSKYSVLSDLKQCLKIESMSEVLRGHPIRNGILFDSLYGSILKHWMQYFPKNRFFIVSTKELQLDSIRILERLSKFLGVEAKKGVIQKLNTRSTDHDDFQSFKRVESELRSFFREDMDLFNELTHNQDILFR